MSEWKPGDVIADTEGVLYFVIEVSENTRSAWKTGKCVVSADGNGHYLGDLELPHEVLVIDRHNDEQVDRLADAFCSARWSHIPDSDECDPLTRSSLRTALRNFANPPKPEEPTGLGAVVADDREDHWVSLGQGSWWRDEYTWRAWDDFNAVRVLSPGVEADS